MKWEKLTCTKCFYAEPVHDKHGLTTGISCGHNNMRFIDWETASVMCCGAWAEIEDDRSKDEGSVYDRMLENTLVNQTFTSSWLVKILGGKVTDRTHHRNMVTLVTRALRRAERWGIMERIGVDDNGVNIWRRIK